MGAQRAMAHLFKWMGISMRDIGLMTFRMVKELRRCQMARHTLDNLKKGREMAMGFTPKQIHQSTKAIGKTGSWMAKAFTAGSTAESMTANGKKAYSMAMVFTSGQTVKHIKGTI